MGDQLFRVGMVIGVHGLKGDLKVRPETRDSEALLQAGQVFLRRPGAEMEAYRPARVAPHKGGFILRLAGLDDINSVERLVGCEVLMPLDQLSELPEGENYWYELKGLRVVDRRLGELGELAELFTTAAHDLYVVRGARGEVLIPAVRQFVLEVDLEAGRMLVDLPEGLVPEPDEV